MTHRGVIDWVARTLGKSSVKLNNHTMIHKNPERWKPQWKYQLFGKRAQLLCRRLLPYLKVKDEQAKIILEFPCDLRVAPGAKIDEKINATRYELRRRIRGLNSRGPAKEEAC